MNIRSLVLMSMLVAVSGFGESHVYGQGRDSLLNGTVIGGAIGAGAGVAFTHAVRDSDLTFSQYAYGALVFGAIGAGAGLGIDALLNRASTPITRRRVVVAPAVWRDAAGVAVLWRW